MGIVVAIDGPGGAGKSTVSRGLAARLGFAYVDTGAMYRVIGVLAAERGLALDDTEALAALCDATRIEFGESPAGPTVGADGRDMTAIIRTPAAAQDASRYSTVGVVRDRLVAQQRAIGAAQDVVMEGRDIGTVVFPDALLKVYLDAVPRERARRRATEMDENVSDSEIERMAQDIATRDERDRSRANSPLRPAVDAVPIDSTDLTIDAVIDALFALVQERRNALASAG